MKGIILSSSYGRYKVLGEDGATFELTPRGIFRKDKKTLVVGDKVIFSLDTKTIDEVLTRDNFSKRPLIANIDYLAIVSSVKKPDFSFELIFKFLTYANSIGVKPIIIITKSDYLDENMADSIKKELDLLKIKYFFTNKYDPNSIEELKTFLKDNTTCFMGQSGVGKSSLLNLIDENFNRNIGEYSEALGRGKHETKETILLPYENGFIADSPGFSSLILDLSEDELANKFIGFDAYSCRFNDCHHINAIDCGVIDAYKEGKISSRAYECYLKLMDEALQLKRGR